MELNEQLKTIIEALIGFGLDGGEREALNASIEAYGNNCYNQAVNDAESIAAKYASHIKIDIRNLKKH